MCVGYQDCCTPSLGVCLKGELHGGGVGVGAGGGVNSPQKAHWCCSARYLRETSTEIARRWREISGKIVGVARIIFLSCMLSCIYVCVCLCALMRLYVAVGGCAHWCVAVCRCV